MTGVTRLTRFDDFSFCGAVDPVGKRVCVKDKEHEGKHGWERDDDPLETIFRLRAMLELTVDALDRARGHDFEGARLVSEKAHEVLIDTSPED